MRGEREGRVVRGETGEGGKGSERGEGEGGKGSERGEGGKEG